MPTQDRFSPAGAQLNEQSLARGQPPFTPGLGVFVCQMDKLYNYLKWPQVLIYRIQQICLGMDHDQ